MDITIQNKKLEAKFKNGKYFHTFTPKSVDEVVKIHHQGCVGDTRLTHIQLEQNNDFTYFVEPSQKVNSLSGIFKNLRDLDVQLRDQNSDFWGKIKLNNKGMLTEFYNQNIETKFTAMAGTVNAAVKTLENNVVKKSDVTITPNSISFGTGKTIDGNTVASLMKLQPDSIKLISPLISVTGDMIVDGALTSNKFAANSVKAGHIAGGAIEGYHIKAGAFEAEFAKISRASIEKLLTNSALITELFAQKAFINNLKTVKIDATQIDTDTLRGKTITGVEINGVNITGSSTIKIGQHGYMRPSGDGLRFCLPYTSSAKSGVGIQMLGNTGRGNSPYGLYIYPDPNFDTSDVGTTDSYIVTVNGYISTKGVNNLKFTNYTDSSTSIGVWDKDVSLLFDRTDNDIFYQYRGKYSLWGLIKEHYDTTSDVKLKKDIKDSQAIALEKLKKFKFKSFNWKPSEAFGIKPYTEIGLIAQEVEKIDKNFVKKVGEYLTLNEFNLLTLALKAIQELSEENKQIKKEMEILKNAR